VKVRSFLFRSFVAFLPALFLAGVAPAFGITVDQVLATVDKEPVTLSDYLLYARSLGMPAEKDRVDERVLRQLIEERVILLEAGKKGIETSDAEADRMLEEVRKESGLSPEGFERQLAQDGTNLQRYRSLLKARATATKLVESEVNPKVHVTEKEIEDFYQADRSEFVSSPAQVEVKAIFFRLEEGATVTEITNLKLRVLQVAARLKAGDDFDMLVDRYSDEPLRSKRGRLGRFKRGTLIPQLDKQAFSMKAGEVSEPLWVKEGGYIIKLEEKSGEGYKPLADVREEIYKRLFEQRKEEIFSEWVKLLWEKASITIN
jgi:parvulin-like peptidyl-prolyl isomerase